MREWNTAACLLMFASAALAADPLLFSYFRNNGEDGLHLATSGDGLRWRVLQGGKALLEPKVGESKLMRDPSIARGPDGTFHMVWTTSWPGAFARVCLVEGSGALVRTACD